MRFVTRFSFPSLIEFKGAASELGVRQPDSERLDAAISETREGGRRKLDVNRIEATAGAR
jgi:hypothetical protein